MIKEKELVLYFKALNDETRLKIIQMLAQENLCACHILKHFNFTQPTLSYHMKILVDSQLVYSQKDGNWTRYILNQALFEEVGIYFNQIASYTAVDRNVDVC